MPLTITTVASSQSPLKSSRGTTTKSSRRRQPPRVTSQRPHLMRKGSNMLTSVPNGLLHPFNSGNTSIYSPLSKTSHYGPIAPFLRTCGRSAIQARTVRTRIPTTINSYKNVRAFKNDLRTVCPSRLDGPRYIKLNQNEVLLTLHVVTPQVSISCYVRRFILISDAQ
jgi:hypothetical protein